MLFAIDIDGTIATAFRGYAEYYNQELGLGIAPAIIASLTSYADMFRLPELVAYRKKNEAQFKVAASRVTESLLVMNRRHPMAGARGRLAQLARTDRVRYYTIRTHEDQSINQEMQTATRHWLALNGFPNPDDVVFCKSFRAKLALVAKEPDEQIIFIDDRWADLLTVFEKLIDEGRTRFVEDMRQRLTLIAYGVSCIPESTHGLRVHPLPDWEHVDDILLTQSMREEVIEQ